MLIEINRRRFFIESEAVSSQILFAIREMQLRLAKSLVDKLGGEIVLTPRAVEH